MQEESKTCPRDSLSDAELKKVKSPKAEQAPKPKTSRKKKEVSPAQPPSAPITEGMVCPLCGQGRIIRGNTAFGCSRWREGCTYRHLF